jgi:hypothetical protein
MEIKKLCNLPFCYKDEPHQHKSTQFKGHRRYYLPPTCNWQTANTLTDYEVVKCTNRATHKIPEGDAILQGENLCLAHADLYRTITHQMPEKLDGD